MAHVEIKAAAPFDDTHTNTSRQKTNANLVHIRESATGNFGILLFFLRGGEHISKEKSNDLWDAARTNKEKKEEDG